MPPDAPAASRKERPVFTAALPDPDPDAGWRAAAAALEAGTRKARYGLVGGYTPFRFCFDRRVRVGAADDPAARTWELGVSRDVMRSKELPWTVAAETGLVLLKGSGGRWVVRSLESGHIHTRVTPERGPPKDLVVSPRGDRLFMTFAAAPDGVEGPEIRAYELPGGRLVGAVRLPGAPAVLALAPDGAAAAVGTDDGWVRRFDGADLSELDAFGVESAWAPAALALAPGAARVATALRTGEVKAWAGDGAPQGDWTLALGYRGRGALVFLDADRLALVTPGGVACVEVAARPVAGPPARRFRRGDIAGGSGGPAAAGAPGGAAGGEADTPDADAGGGAAPDPESAGDAAADARIQGRGLLPRVGADLAPGTWWLAADRARRDGQTWRDAATGLPLFAWRVKDGAPMVLVPAGTCQIGDEAPPAAREDTARFAPFSRALGAFYIDQYPVTTGQYASFLAAAGADEPDDWAAQRAAAENPVVFVHLGDAKLYARWVAGAVPTEAEWVRAARGDSDAAFPWGRAPAEGVRPARYGLGPGGEAGRVDGHPAGASPFAVMDLAGNVREWCADPYPAARVDDPYAFETPDPLGPPCAVTKGGSFLDDWVHLRVSGRWPAPVETRDRALGFRLVVPLEPRPAPATMTGWPAGES